MTIYVVTANNLGFGHCSPRGLPSLPLYSKDPSDSRAKVAQGAKGGNGAKRHVLLMRLYKK